MAHAKPPFPFSGTLGQFVFFTQDGKQYVRTRPEFNKKKWNKPYSGPRRAAEAFGGAQICASHIYRSLKVYFKSGGLMPYGHNHIAGKLRKQAYYRGTSTEAFTSQHIISALHRLDLGAGKQTAQTIRTSLVGPNHDPHTVVIRGIQEAAQQIDPTGQLNLQFQVKVLHLAIQPYERDHDHKVWRQSGKNPIHQSLALQAPRSTQWHPVQKFQEETLRLPIQKTTSDSLSDSLSTSLPPEGTLTFLSIQFRTASRSRRPAVLHEHVLLRCISVHMSEEKAADHSIQNTKPRRNYRPRRVCQPSARSRATSSVRRKSTPQPPAPRQAGGPRSATRWAAPQLE